LACREVDTGNFLECGMMGTGVKEKKELEDDVTFKELTKILKPFIESDKGSDLGYWKESWLVWFIYIGLQRP
jgi:ATP-dependent DNA ligase